MKPLRRPVTPDVPNIFVPPVPDRLPARTPGESPQETITRLTDERDGVMVRLDEVSRERNELLDETERLAKERDELATMVAALEEDLAARSLPTYGTATSWPPTKDPVHSRLFDGVAIELDFMPGQRTDDDEPAQQDEVES